MTNKKQYAPQKIGVVLMTYGSPETLSIQDVHAYLKNVYGGREPDAENVKEFQRRYKIVGGSPLIEITQDQAAALEMELNKRSANGIQFQGRAGMRFSHPYIHEVVNEFDKDTTDIVGIIMSPQYSPIIMSGYQKTLEAAVKNLNYQPTLHMATDWHLEPYFIDALTKRVQEALDTLPKDIKKTVPVLFSAHSMPKRVIDKEPNYINDLKETAAEVAKKVGLPKSRWLFCYQSAGHTPEEWLKPDFADIMPQLQKKGKTHVIIAPVQFLADHLEILYDVEVGAREQAEEHGIIFTRTQSLNTSPLFIKTLASVVGETLATV